MSPASHRTGCIGRGPRPSWCSTTETSGSRSRATELPYCRIVKIASSYSKLGARHRERQGSATDHADRQATDKPGMITVVGGLARPPRRRWRRSSRLDPWPPGDRRAPGAGSRFSVELFAILMVTMSFAA